VEREDERQRPGDGLTRAMIPVAMALLVALGRGAGAQVVVDGAVHHLGTAGEPEWQEFARDDPEGRSLTVRFRAVDLATGLGDRLRLRVTGLGPSWTRADRVSNWSKREDRVSSETALVRRVHLGRELSVPP
jgi:hypothetical protein